MKTHYSAAELAAMELPGLPVSEPGIRIRAGTNNWSSREVTCKGGKGGKRTEYAVASLPKEVREAIQAHQLDAILKNPPTPAAIEHKHELKPRKHEAFRADGAMVRGSLIRRAKPENKLTDKDRARRAGALVLCQAVEAAMALSHCSAKHAIRELADRALAGIARPELIDAVAITYTKPRQGGQTLDSLTSRLQKMYAAYSQGRSEGDAARYLVPGTSEKRGQNPIHVHAFIIHYCHPSRPPVTESWRASHAWFAAQNLPIPAIDTFYRIEKSLPVTIKYRGRMTGSEWRGIKPYIDRDVSMFKSNDIWVGDGHSFKAKVQHPIHGNPFTPEVTVILDWISRKIVGWSIDLAENQIAVSAAFRHGQKTTRARPLIYYSDNGSGQTGKTIDCPIHGTLARQGIVHETGIPGNPQGRGIIERLWQVTTIPLARTYPTCTWRGSDKETMRKMLVAMNKADGSGRAILPSFEQFLEDIKACFTAYNLHHEHRELGGMTPELAYHAKLDPDSIACGPTDAELDVLWMPEETRTPQRGVVSLFGNEYARKDLVNILADGEKVRVRYDLHNAERVWLMRTDGTYIGEAKWNGHKVAAFPVPRVEQLREERAEGKINRAELRIAEARAELGAVIDGEILTPVVFPEQQPEPVLEAVQPIEQEKEEESSFMDTVKMLYGTEQDPVDKEEAAQQ